MQKHTKVYLGHFWLMQHEVKCEICWHPAVDIHHIEPRSSFGKNRKKEQDAIWNLIALCRKHHEQAHWIGGKISKQELQLIHLENL